MSDLSYKLLEEVADIRVSNVDKKSFGHETKVRLCNYMDTYSKNVVSDSFGMMVATASPNEIERFRLQPGDVVITKDSESPDDIAVPVYVDEYSSDLPMVCGYHQALLRPKKEKLNGAFLCHLLRLPKTNQHFAKLATGSTRFGLSLESIHKLPLNLPSIDEQRRIAEILSTVDEQVSNLRLQIRKQETLTEALYAKFFQNLPKGDYLGNLIECYAGGTPSRAVSEFFKGPIPWVKSTECNLSDIYSTAEHISEAALHASSAKPVPKKSVLLAMYGATAGAVSYTHVDCATNQAVLAFPPGKNHCERFLYHWLKYQKPNLLFKSQGSGQPNLSKELISTLPYTSLSKTKQSQIAILLDSIKDLITQAESELSKLLEIKLALMNDLLTGKMRVPV